MVNKVILIGNVGADPEVRAMEGGVKVARLRLATTERYRDRQSNENKEHTEWHTVTLWRGLADVVDNYVRKGSQIYIEGRLRTREWTDQQGQKRYATEVVADEAYFVDAKSESPASLQQGSPMGMGMGMGMPQANQYVPSNYGGEPAFSSQGNGTPNFTELSDDEELPF